jgi:uncharacterized C2H2 Zn-finger protein
MRNTLFTCITCDDIFRTHPDLKKHVRHKHQSVVKVKFQTGRVAEVKKGADGTFKCTCGKGFKIPWSLQKHAKECSNELTESKEDGMNAELMDVDDSDASESLIADARVIPADCFGALISYESADCRGRRTP